MGLAVFSSHASSLNLPSNLTVNLTPKRDRKGEYKISPIFTFRMKLIEPIGHFQHKCSVFSPSGIREIVVRIDQKQVGYRQVTPLKPGIDVQVVCLVVVLHVGGEEQFVGKSDIQLRADQPKTGVLPGLGEAQMIVTIYHGNVAVRLKFVDEIA